MRSTQQRKEKDQYAQYISPPDQVIKDDMRDLEQLPTPMILMGDFIALNPLWGSEKMSTSFNLLCLNKKKKPTTEHKMAAN